MADLHRAVADAVTGLRSQLSTLTTQIGTAQDRPHFGLFGGESAVSDAAMGRIDKTVQAFASRLESIERSVAVMEERVVRAEKEAEAAKQQVNVLHSAMAEDFITFEQTLQKQEKAVDSARTAMAQTDDLVERLVEALEALQSSVLERSSDDYSAAVIN
jgi:chromosome segregation ATPase